MNKQILSILVGIFLVVGMVSISEAKKDNRVFLKTIGYTSQDKTVSYGDAVINAPKFRANIDVRARCDTCKFHKFIDGPGLFRLYGIFENSGISVEVKNLRITDVVFDKESSIIKATATVIRYIEDKSREVSNAEPITINTYSDHFDVVFDDGIILGKFYTKIIY